MSPVRWKFKVAIVPGFLIAIALFTVTLHSQQNSPRIPDSASPLYVTTFVDLIPPGAGAGTAAIKRYVLDTRKDPGILRCEAIAQIAGLSNHLMVIEVWKDEAAYRNHEVLAHTLDYRARLAPLIGAPFVQREHALVQ